MILHHGYASLPLHFPIGRLFAAPSVINTALEIRQLLSYTDAMNATRMTIGELADAVGLNRRAIRFYVQRGLLPPPVGRGRGSWYGEEHLKCLRQIDELQRAGHSLDAIKRILDGGETPPPEALPGRRPRRQRLSAELWTRVSVADGIELSFDATRYNPDVTDLLALQQNIRSILHTAGGDNGDRPTSQP